MVHLCVDFECERCKIGTINIYSEVLLMSTRIQITLKDDVAKTLEDLALEMGVTKSVIVTLAIQEYERKRNAVEVKK